MAGLKDATANLNAQIEINTKHALEIEQNENSLGEAAEFIKSKNLPRKSRILANIDSRLITYRENLPYRYVDKGSDRYKAMVNSIASQGMIQPPLVYIAEDEIVLLVGRHRLEAWRELEELHEQGGSRNANPYKKIQVCILSEAEHEHEPEDIMFMENFQRKENSPLTIAAWVGAKAEQGTTNLELGEILGKDREWVRRYLVVDQWPKSCKQYIEKNMDSFNQTILHKIAKKKYQGKDQLLAELTKVVSPQKQLVGATDARIKREQKLLERLEQVFNEHEHLVASRDHIHEALIALGFLSDDKDL